MSFSRYILLLGPVVALTAHAEIYMSDEQAAKAIFSDGVFARTSVDLTDADLKAIIAKSGEEPRAKKLVVFVQKDKSAVMIDQVLGKHEFITFAVGVTPDGAVKGIEILEYRESYGQQVRQEDWRKQFFGKTTASKLKLNDDIKNISGATLSSAHVTAGVKRLLHTYQVIRDRL